MTRRPLDPRKCPVAIDANALDRDGSERDALVDRLLCLSAAGTTNLIVPKGVRQEILNPQTPAHIQDAVLRKIFTISVGLNSDEERRHCRVTQELQGNARPGRHEADADHLFEAAKYSGYLITHDDRIHKRAERLRDVLPPTLTVVTLTGFFAIYDGWEARYPR
jgi:hypothetical protein